MHTTPELARVNPPLPMFLCSTAVLFCSGSFIGIAVRQYPGGSAS